MHSGILYDIKMFFRTGNMVTKLILVNLVITVLLVLLNVVVGNSAFSTGITKYFLVSDNIFWDLTHPWVFLTHIFISNNIIDLIWNMFILYWFGIIIGDMIGDDKVLPLYVMGGVFGAFIYILLLNISGFSGFRFISGCNTAVLSIVVASAVLVPNYNLRLLFFGNVSLKLVVIIYVSLQLIYAYTGYNTIFYSLIGGILFGWLYVYSIGKHWRLDRKFNNMFESVKGLFSFPIKYKQNKNLSVRYKSKKSIFTGKQDRDKVKLDDILKKIKEVGYESLTESEKEFLFLASKD